MALPRYFENWGDFSENIGNKTLGDVSGAFTPTQWDTYSPVDPELMQSSLDVLAENDFWLFSECSGSYPLQIIAYGAGHHTVFNPSGEDYKSSKFNPSMTSRNDNHSSKDELEMTLAPLTPEDLTRRLHLCVDGSGPRWMNCDPSEVYSVYANGASYEDPFRPFQRTDANTPSAARWLSKPIYIPCDSGICEHQEDGYLKISIDCDGYVCTPHGGFPYRYSVWNDPDNPETDPNGCILDVYLNNYNLGSTTFGIQNFKSDGSAVTQRGVMDCSFIVPAANVSSGYLSFHKRNESTGEPLYFGDMTVRVERYHTTN